MMRVQAMCLLFKDLVSVSYDILSIHFISGVLIKLCRSCYLECTTGTLRPWVKQASPATVAALNMQYPSASVRCNPNDVSPKKTNPIFFSKRKANLQAEPPDTAPLGNERYCCNTSPPPLICVYFYPLIFFPSACWCEVRRHANRRVKSGRGRII